jgi:hypothetical protein
MALGWRKEYQRYREQFLNVVKLYQKREDIRVYLEIILSLGTIIFFALFALRPTILTISQLYKDIKSKEEIVIKLDEKINNLEIAQGLVTQKQAFIEIARLSVPGEPTPESFARQIEGLSQASSISLLGISVGEVTLMGDVKKGPQDKDLTPLPEGAMGMQFSLSISGNYQNLYAFLTSLENLRRPVAIDGVSITTNKNDQEEIKITMLVSGRAPFLK